MAEQIVELAPGENKLVSFEAIPNEARVYQVSINGLAGSFRTITAPGPLELGSVTILDINGKLFVETGIEDGIPYGVLAEPLVLSSWTISVHMRDNTIVMDEDNFTHFFFEFWPVPAWDAEFPWSSPPAYRGFKRAPLECEQPEKGCPPSVYVAKPPFELTIPLNEVFAGGYWTQGIYDGHFHCCVRLFDQYLGPCLKQFNIRNMVRMTSEKGE